MPSSSSGGNTGSAAFTVPTPSPLPFNGTVSGGYSQIAATGGLGPVLIGVQGEQKLSDLLQKGYTIVSGQTEVATVEGTRIYDFLVRAPGDNTIVGVDEQADLIGVESKATTTNRIKLIQDQVRKDLSVVQKGGLTAGGQRVSGVLYGIVANNPQTVLGPIYLRKLLEENGVPFVTTPLGAIEGK